MAQVLYESLNKLGTSAERVRWSILGQVDWREWDGEFVVRAERSGITTLLAPWAGQVLKALRAGGCDADEIARRIYADRMQSGAASTALTATFADPSADAQHVAAVLAELEALGFVRSERT